MFDQILGDVPTPLKFVLAFAVVILLIVICAWLIRRFGGQRLGPSAGGRSRQPRLGVLDVLAIDGRRRLVIVRRDNVEHLVLIGGPNDVVVESGILRVPAGMTAQRDAPALAPVEPQVQRPQPQAPAPQVANAPRVAPPPPPPSAPVAPPKVAEAPPLAPAAPVRAPQPEPARLAPGQVRAPAPQPVRPAVPELRPSQPIISGPAPQRIADPETRTNELAERLAAALKRPVTPSVRPIPAPKPAETKPAETKAPEAKPAEAKAPEPKAPEPKPAPGKPEPAQKPADDLPREMPSMTDKAEAPAKPGSDKPSSDKPGAGAPSPAKPAAAPEVKGEQRQPAKPSDDEDDPLASLEAEMANLLGRDVGKK